MKGKAHYPQSVVFKNQINSLYKLQNILNMHLKLYLVMANFCLRTAVLTCLITKSQFHCTNLYFFVHSCRILAYKLCCIWSHSKL